MNICGVFVQAQEHNFFVVFCFSFFVLSAFFLQPKKPSPMPSTYSIYVLDIVVSEHNLSRFHQEQRSWLRKMNETIPLSTFKVAAGYRMREYETILFSKGPSEFRPFSYVWPFLHAMRDFIDNTDRRWFFRTTDDVFVDLRKFDEMMSDFESMFDPLKESVVKGSVVGDKMLSFLHGGSGWIMSRHAVESLLQQVSANQIVPQKVGDDVLVSSIFETNMGWNLSEMNDNRFQGSALSDSSREMLRLSSFHNINRCMTTKYVNAHDIVVWHSGEPYMTVVDLGPILHERIPLDAYVELDKSGRLIFCKIDSTQIIFDI